MVFFEKQEGQLCAQHALNALLQGHYFTAPDLAEIARRLDNQERVVYAQGGPEGEDYLRQFQFDSQNMDDSGYFSVQVIGEALKIWNLEMVPYQSTSDDEAIQAQIDPTAQTAYICNFREHWFTIRKVGQRRWFNLNSMQNAPSPVSDTYLSLLLTQLLSEGYSIFVIKGTLPNCDADNIIDYNDAIIENTIGTNTSPVQSCASISETSDRDVIAPSLAVPLLGRQPSEDDPTLRRALAMSRAAEDAQDRTLQRALAESLVESGGHSSQDNEEWDEEEDLRRALQMSLAGEGESEGKAVDDQTPTTKGSKPLTMEELRQRRLAYLEKQTIDKPGGSADSDTK